MDHPPSRIFSSKRGSTGPLKSVEPLDPPFLILLPISLTTLCIVPTWCIYASCSRRHAIQVRSASPLRCALHGRPSSSLRHALLGRPAISRRCALHGGRELPPASAPWTAGELPPLCATWTAAEIPTPCAPWRSVSSRRRASPDSYVESVDPVAVSPMFVTLIAINRL
jgi:hypothetical protein